MKHVTGAVLMYATIVKGLVLSKLYKIQTADGLAMEFCFCLNSYYLQRRYRDFNIADIGTNVHIWLRKM